MAKLAFYIRGKIVEAPFDISQYNDLEKSEIERQLILKIKEDTEVYSPELLGFIYEIIPEYSFLELRSKAKKNDLIFNLGYIGGGVLIIRLVVGVIAGATILFLSHLEEQQRIEYEIERKERIKQDKIDSENAAEEKRLYRKRQREKKYSNFNENGNMMDAMEKITNPTYCSLCQGTGIEKNRNPIKGINEEYGRRCPMCDGKGRRSY